MNSLEKLLVQSYIAYQPESIQDWHHQVTIERRGQRDGSFKWGIYKNGSVLYKSLQDFQYESSGSERTPEDLLDTRFDTAQEALNFWKKIEPEYILHLKN